MAHAFRACALAHPGRVLAAQRAGDEWISISWGAAREQADAIAQALLDRGLGAGRPLMVLSGNSIEHLVLTLGAYTAGVPIVPVSTAYSLLCADHEHIRAVAELCRPGSGVSAPQRTSGPS